MNIRREFTTQEELAKSASALNEASEQLNTKLLEAEQFIRGTNIGLVAYLDDEQQLLSKTASFQAEDLDGNQIPGYTMGGVVLGWDRVGDEWGLVVRDVSIKFADRAELKRGDHTTEFSGIPRSLLKESRLIRLEAIGWIDKLMKKLVYQADVFVDDITGNSIRVGGDVT